MSKSIRYLQSLTNKNKYHNIDLHNKDNATRYIDCLGIVEDLGIIFDNNKVDGLTDLKSIETINNNVDKEINNILKIYGYDSWIINI